jgi:anti-sigma regulatory factor (Ser/Thr protein kinase)
MFKDDSIDAGRVSAAGLMGKLPADMDSPMALLTPNGRRMLETLQANWTSISFDERADDGAARRVRHQVMGLARLLPFNDSDLDSIETAVGEAALNAAKHGSPRGGEDRLHVCCARTGGRFIIEITDQGSGFIPEFVAEPIAENLCTSGYGICLMRGLMDETRFTLSHEGGTTVHLMKRYATVD